MGYSDSGSSSAVEYKNLRQYTRDRLLYEMLQSVKMGSSESTYARQVLIVDKLTEKIMSTITEEEERPVMDPIFGRRDPLPTWNAIYFMQPSKENVTMFMSDMSGKSPLYKKAFVFFSSPISKELVDHIKEDATVLARIGALNEVNVEYFAIDSQGFITDNETALVDLYGDDENTRKGDACLNGMATRIATVFGSLKEFPLVRYRAAKSLDAATMTTYRDLIPTKLAAGIWNCLVKYKQALSDFPQSETCELLILDRSVDQIAPVIHEWTYDALCHDLLNLKGNKYVQEVPSKAGDAPKEKEVLLDDRDPVWLELRYAHIAEASIRLDEMTNSLSKNIAAQFELGSRDGELSTRDLDRIVQALPQYTEQKEKLSPHVEIAEKINRIIREAKLGELGQLEQDLVFGYAGMKEVINFLTTNQDASRENKLRLLMILAAIYPEKVEGESGLNLMKLAKLPTDDMAAVNNMRLLAGAPESKKSWSTTFSLTFNLHKKNRAVRKEHTGEDVQWKFSKFYPMIEELIGKLCNGELSKDEYPCMNDPSPTFHGTVAHSMRSRRTHTWARPSNSVHSSDFKKNGRRVFVFIVGGATRSELRACHKLTNSLNRDVILGSSSIIDPPEFITNMKMMKEHELSLDDIEI